MGLDYNPNDHYDPNDLLDMRNVQIGPTDYSQVHSTDTRADGDDNYSYDTSPYMASDGNDSCIAVILNMLGGLAVLSAMFGPRDADITSRWYMAIGLFVSAWIINKIKQ